jgi:uncharacterized protein YggE
METYLKDKKINASVFILLVVLSLFVVVKFINEIKLSSYVGRGNQPANVISVSGFGEVLAVADIASLNINITKEGLTANEAQESLNELITKTLTYLSEQKIEDKDIKSEYGGLNPKYSYERCYTYNCPTTSKIVGYTATQMISIKIREVDNANIVRTGLAEIGITDITGPTFMIDEEDSFKSEARSIAIKEAQDKAKVLAKELGVNLGKVVSYSEGSDGYYPMNEYRKTMDMALGGSSAPTLPKGENKITSNVTITYEIR